MSGSDDRRIRFGVLGPLCVTADGREVPIRAGRERITLAVLLLHAGRAVSVERLVEAIWGGEPPRSARNQVQSSVSLLRRRLAKAGAPDQVIATDPAGYRIRMAPDQVDVHRFRTVVAEARTAVAAGRRGEARESYRAAVGLWRGPALAGLDSDAVRDAAGGLEAEREQALEECLETELALGGASELVGELTELVRQHPYRERLHGALMRALYRAGRPADALAAYRRARQLFHDELGTEPGEQLQKLHQAILNRDPDLDVVDSAPAPGPAPAGLRELPVEASCFVGRDGELARLRDVLAPPDRSARRRPPVAVLFGPGGTGKSALAVRAAHELAGEYPDGQLYVDLCGSTPGMRPVPAVEVLGRFLRRLGVHPSEVPSARAEAAALFRSVTADRRLLFVLDNAADKEQVADLVPGTPSCAVLVTSRYPMPTLDADDRLRVEALPDSDGLALLTGLTDRLAAEPGAAKEIVGLCGGLPLAIRVAAGRLACRPDLPVAEYAQRLADRSRRLDELQLDDLAVRASIRTSYDALLADGDQTGALAARAFRMLGLLHVPDVAPWVVAAMLTEQEVETVRGALDRLVDAQLLEALRGGRYRLHDLVRLVATERAMEEGARPGRTQAIARAISFYAVVLRRAESALRPGRTLPFDLPRLPDPASLPSLRQPARARAWIDEEISSLTHILEQATTMYSRLPQLLPWFFDSVWFCLDARCEWQAASRVSHLAVETAKACSDPGLAACGDLLQGRSEACLGSYDSAVVHLDRALGSLREMENDAAVVIALNGLGLVHQRRGEPEVALGYLEDALELALECDMSSVAASVLSNMSVGYAMLGQSDHAVVASERGFALSVAAEDLVLQASSLINLAAASCESGDYPRAVRCSDDALALSREAGDRRQECESLVIRSEVKLRAGDLAGALYDIEIVHSIVRASGYRYAAASALRQQSRVLVAMGRTSDAKQAASAAAAAFTQLTACFRDPTIELLLDVEHSAHATAAGH